MSADPKPERTLVFDAKFPSCEEELTQTECIKRISRVCEYLKATMNEETVTVYDFPRAAMETASLHAMMKQFRFTYVCLLDPRNGVTPKRHWSLPWPHLKRVSDRSSERSSDIHVDDPALTIQNENIQLPPHVYPRLDPRHDACVPMDMPDRNRVCLVSPDEADGVRGRMDLALRGIVSRHVHPRSMTMQDAYTVFEPNTYVASPKHDGTRYTLCFEDVSKTGIAYFVNRARQVFRRNISGGHLDGTILDVECTKDKIIVLDAFIVNNVPTDTMTTFTARVRAASAHIEHLARYWGNVEMQTYEVVRKGMDLDSVCTKDGIVFTRQRQPFTAFKFKPPSENTLDVLNDGTLVPVVDGAAVIEVRPVVPSLVHGDWEFVRVRDDKDSANPQWVRDSIIQSMMDNVTLDQLKRIAGPDLPGKKDLVP